VVNPPSPSTDTAPGKAKRSSASTSLKMRTCRDAKHRISTGTGSTVLCGDVRTWWRGDVGTWWCGNVGTWRCRGVARYARLRYNPSVTTFPWYDVSKGVARYAPTQTIHNKQYTIRNTQYTTRIVGHRLSCKKVDGSPARRDAMHRVSTPNQYTNNQSQ
jgi:hypothetical protein